MYLELPPENEDEKPETEQEAEDKKLEPAPQRCYKNYDNSYAYLVSVSLKDNGFSCMTVLLHKEQIPADRLKAMADESAQVVLKTRTEQRRKEMAAKKTAVASSIKLNESHFEDDVKYFEAVMMDKFDFRKLVCENAATELVPTILERW